MLQGEKPFGSWRESEIDIITKIAKGQLNFPKTLGPEAVDLISKVFISHYSFFLLSYKVFISFRA